MRLFHIGVVVDDIAAQARVLGEVVGMRPVTDVLADPIQRVRGQFLAGADGDGVRLELLQPAAPDSPVSTFLERRGGGLHHLCFEVPDVEAAVAAARARGARVVCSPVPSEALGGRRIAFVVLAGRLVIEFVEQAGS